MDGQRAAAGEEGWTDPIVLVTDALRQGLVYAAAGVAMVVVLRQCRKPAAWLGRLFLLNMNARHSALTNWGLSHTELAPDFTMLDVGCGGGKTIDTLAGVATGGHVSGIDYSAASVAQSRRTNAKWIEAGRVDISQASVSSLPFEPDTFDVVTGVETHYYWPTLPADVKGILRVLKPGGHLLIIAETYKGRSADWLYRPTMWLLRATYLTVAEHRALFEAAGFSDVQVFEERTKGWICALGRKPAPQ